MSELVEMARRFLEQRPELDPAPPDLAASPTRLVPRIGEVAVVLSKSGHKALAVIEDLLVVEEKPGLKSGYWYLVSSGETIRLVHGDLIVDTDPACPTCGQRGRWWQVEETVIRCDVCHPCTGTHGG